MAGSAAAMAPMFLAHLPPSSRHRQGHLCLEQNCSRGEWTWDGNVKLCDDQLGKHVFNQVQSSARSGAGTNAAEQVHAQETLHHSRKALVVVRAQGSASISPRLR